MGKPRARLDRSTDSLLLLSLLSGVEDPILAWNTEGLVMSKDDTSYGERGVLEQTYERYQNSFLPFDDTLNVEGDKSMFLMTILPFFTKPA